MASASSYNAELENLHAQIHALEKKLGDLHCTDVNHLRRAYTTLTQHAQALDIESKHLSNLISELQTSIISAQYVATELTYTSAVVAASYTIDRCLRLARLPSPSLLLAVAATSLVVWRLARTSSRRLLEAMERNKRTKQQLLTDWKVVQQRIAVLAELARADLSKYRKQGGQA
mmetsp:Transcript_26066/g.56917  ORF Transcript_26066/g.56917 Transcript_26066/m.56917 type:complete len:174 (+) Transcript_26066:149-670(+)|eukprot:CAMPEP_0202904998 /NCGR_PEP_ID=MMETSP1392-20130828/32049_1 /ASSEMBLY_ACC=CAM_ASM_000868 /TAXON_ID=225041 /ORGANISM="Chlamydomonas chlamydogama, Strain SAG 11-48b" /LENGTH=173 /DNA_ID=CAMNT_0049592903 /DNA_START=51 /DNA_END=572 /DNA_ORIENTATION=-